MCPYVVTIIGILWEWNRDVSFSSSGETISFKSTNASKYRCHTMALRLKFCSILSTNDTEILLGEDFLSEFHVDLLYSKDEEE
jgi:hypothetical protein